MCAGLVGNIDIIGSPISCWNTKLCVCFTTCVFSSNPAFLETTLLIAINLTADGGDNHEAKDECDDEPYFTDWRRILLDDSGVVIFLAKN